MRILDKRNPLTKGLVFDMPFFERGGTTVRDLVSNVKGTLTNSPTWGQDIYGSHIGFDGGIGGDDIINVTTNSTQNNIQTLTIECLIDPTGYGETNAGRIATKKSGGTSGAGTGFWNLAVEQSAANNQNGIFFIYGRATTHGQWNSATDSIKMHQWNHVIITYDAQSTANDAIFYINGNLSATTERSTPNGAVNADDTNLYIGNRSAGDRTYQGNIAYFRYWKRILAPIEARILYQNPWGIYYTPKFTLGKVPSAAPPPQVTNAIWHGISF